jgi:flagellar motor switch protein FliN
MADEQTTHPDEQPGDGTGNGAGSGMSQNEIDALFEQDSSEASAEANSDLALADDVAALLGAGGPVLAALAQRAGDVLQAGLESAAGQSVTLAGVEVSVSDYAAIEAEFAEIAHMGFDLRLDLSPSEAHVAAALVPLEDLAALLSLDLGADALMDDEFAHGQMEVVAQAMRELLDLVSLTLFADELAGVEATLADRRVDQPDFTMSMVADVAQGAAPLRLDLAVALPNGSTARVTLVIPTTLLHRLAAMFGFEPASAGTAEATPVAEPGTTAFDPANEPTPLRREAAGAGAGFGISDDPRGFDPSMNPADRTAAPRGASTGDDVDVHPVRFPPLSAYPIGSPNAQSLDLIMDVSMRVTVELGRSTITVEEVLSLGPGSVVELNKLAGEAVDILVNDQLIARGEVVVVDEHFGVRVTEIVSPRGRVQAMGAS